MTKPTPKKYSTGRKRSSWLERRRRLATLQQRRGVSRRRFIAGGVGLIGAGATVGLSWVRALASEPEREGVPVRPPTASHDDDVFQSLCIRCGLCGTVCENGCIRYLGLLELDHGALTPALDVRRRSCTLCMRCTEVCPTGALSKVPAEPEAIQAQVRMGVARVDPGRCLSYLGRVCGYCFDACPYPNHAIKLLPPALPVVLVDGCVGCGRCVELCPQSPTAIDIIPAGETHARQSREVRS